MRGHPPVRVPLNWERSCAMLSHSSVVWKDEMQWGGRGKGSHRAGGHVVNEQATIGKQGGWESLALNSLAAHVTSSRCALWLASRARSEAATHPLTHSVMSTPIW